jgi:hypothetical protein
MYSDEEMSNWRTMARAAMADADLCALRTQLARFTADTFTRVGEELHAIGYIFGPDRVSGDSPGGYGSDEVVGVSLILRIGGELTSASADLFADGRCYAAAALLRQIVEVEYLAWAFQARDSDAQRWLRSSYEERMTFFTPAKLMKAADGQFRGKDYGYHCELGGHPVPDGRILFSKEQFDVSQLLLSDLLGHTGRIWDSVVDWAGGNQWAVPILTRLEEMLKRYTEWKTADTLVLLPPPP